MTTSEVLDRRTVVDRRVRSTSLRYPERRTGFDRRSPGTTSRARLVEAYRRSPSAVAWCAMVIVLLGAADLLLTWMLLGRGATEVNPVMSRLFDSGLGWASVVKGTLTLAVAAGIWLLRRYRRILEFSLVAAAVLSVLVAYEIVGLAILPG